MPVQDDGDPKDSGVGMIVIGSQPREPDEAEYHHRSIAKIDSVPTEGANGTAHSYPPLEAHSDGPNGTHNPFGASPPSCVGPEPVDTIGMVPVKENFTIHRDSQPSHNSMDNEDRDISSCLSIRAWTIIICVVELLALTYQMMSSLIIYTQDSKESLLVLQSFFHQGWLDHPSLMLSLNVVIVGIAMLAVIALLQALDSRNPLLVLPHLIVQAIYIVLLTVLSIVAVAKLSQNSNGHFALRVADLTGTTMASGIAGLGKLLAGMENYNAKRLEAQAEADKLSTTLASTKAPPQTPPPATAAPITTSTPLATTTVKSRGQAPPNPFEEYVEIPAVDNLSSLMTLYGDDLNWTDSDVDLETRLRPEPLFEPYEEYTPETTNTTIDPIVEALLSGTFLDQLPLSNESMAIGNETVSTLTPRTGPIASLNGSQDDISDGVTELALANTTGAAEEARARAARSTDEEGEESEAERLRRLEKLRASLMSGNYALNITDSEEATTTEMYEETSPLSWNATDEYYTGENDYTDTPESETEEETAPPTPAPTTKRKTTKRTTLAPIPLVREEDVRPGLILLSTLSVFIIAAGLELLFFGVVLQCYYELKNNSIRPLPIDD